MANPYLQINIDDMDIEYTFTAQELKGVKIMDMINLNKRGVHLSTYHLPLTGVETGQTLTIRNRDFCLQDSGRYGGVQLVLQADTTTPEASYYYFFKGQSMAFFFDGQGWQKQSFSPMPVAQMSFIKEPTEYGYLNVKDYADVEKQKLFSNLNMKGFSAPNWKGAFFRHGKSEEFGTLKADSFLSHTHLTQPHKHNIQLLGSRKVDVLSGLNYLLKWYDHYKPHLDWGWMLGQSLTIEGNKVWSWVCRVFLGWHEGPESTDEISLKPYKVNTDLPTMKTSSLIQDVGGTETRPQNIAGNYVLKAW